MIGNVETTLRHRFRFFRLIHDRLMSSECEIECQIGVLSSADSDDIHVRFSAMKLWLEDFVDGSIAYNPQNELDISWVNQLYNTTMMTPGEPMDHVIVALLHAKLNAIGAGAVSILRTHFICDTSHGFSNAISGSTEEWLPTMNEWIGERHFHNLPWWHRGDATSIDLQPKPDDDTNAIPDLGGLLVDMIQLDKIQAESAQENQQKSAANSEKSAEIIKLRSRPKLVKTDDN